MDKLVSIIIPVYNVEKYLERCLDSIIDQSFSNFEIILINDGSTDNSPSICETYALSNDKIKVVHQNNKGPSAARNSGLDICCGEFVMFIDSDDFVDSNMIRTLYSDLEQGNADISICNSIKFKSIEDLKTYPNKTNFIEMTSEEVLEWLLTDHELCVPWGKLYRKRLFDHLRFDLEHYNEDMFIIHQLFHLASNITYNSSALYFYSQESESLTRSNFNYRKLDMVEATKLWKEFMEINYPNLALKANTLFMTVMINTCTSLSEMKDEFGKKTYREYRKIISKNCLSYIKAEDVNQRDKIKAILIMLNLYKYFVKLKKIRSSY
ncbi:glycosyltransferase [Fusibacter sp. 3D3]|uniref:glycosyltransferase family 2 protein n=1 Tax=Fusibacter sp. 3D3 TaxID=1048380 RepID=UPI000852DD58|nr:glycosyltransferase [Fusibacter sp. 3D3]GAU77783.1 beta-1,3-glucosyltransferase [Fusibacter sp. 3D3]